MILSVHEDMTHLERTRYTLTETEHDHILGVAAEAEGLFGEPRRGTYELFGWAPEDPEVTGWVGSRVWLVPEDTTVAPWLLEDAEIVGRPSRTNGLVLTGLDEYEGPPEGHRGRVRVHDGHRWLGSCTEFARVLPPRQAAPPLVLKRMAPSEELRAALTKGTRKAWDLEQVALEIRDDRGDPLTDQLLWGSVRAWRPSSFGLDLIDLELDGDYVTPIPTYAQPIWEQWFTGPPATLGAWAALDPRHRGSWLDLVRERACRRPLLDRPAGHAYELDGRHITDEPGLYLALGEAVNGPGGYFGGNLDALDDCLGGTFGYTSPATLLWRDAATAHEHLSETLTPDGQFYDRFASTLKILAEGGMQVTLA